MHGPSPPPYLAGAAAFFHGHGHGHGHSQGRALASDSEALASGFSPRVYTLHHPLVGDHPTTAHKRPSSSAKGEHQGPALPQGSADVAINIPASATWQDPSHSMIARPGQVEERGQLSQPVPAEVSRPLPEKARAKVKVDTREGWDRERRSTGVGIGIGNLANSELVQSLRKFPGGAVTALQNSLNAVLWRSGSVGLSGRKSSFKRSGSMVRSPTLSKNIHSLTSLTEDAEGSSSAKGLPGGGSHDSRRDYQTLVTMGTFALGLFLWLYKGRPLLSLLHAFPAEESAQGPPGATWVELLALLLLLGLVAALTRSAFPRLAKRLRVMAAKGWDRYLDREKFPGGFSLGWGRWNAPAAGHRGKGLRGGVGSFREKRKSSFDGGGSWEYLGPTPRDAPSSPPQESTSYAFSTPSSPDALRTLSVQCGVHCYSNGDRYEGEFYQGKCAGSGVYVFSASGRYEGDWVDGKYDGAGIETWLRGSRYRGQYRKGLREGYGVYRFYTGDVYSGMWAKGQSHGVGVQTCSDGSKYAGEFQWGAKHGVGKYTFRNGDTYAGEYFADKMHGYGVYEFANGHRYEGAWHEGRKQGLGVYTFRNGEERAGHWHLGALETRSTRSSSSTPSGGGVPTPSSPNAVNHSRVLHAVQEARRAASRAEGVLRVDERVAKAVAAANRAAVAARVAAAKAAQTEGGGASLLGPSRSMSPKGQEPEP